MTSTSFLHGKLSRCALATLAAFGFVVASTYPAAAETSAPKSDSGAKVDIASLPVKGGQLNWSLRRSFTKYAGGSREFIDGATESAPDKGYRFPLTAVKSENGRTVASYRGGTKFRAHCGSDAEESCILKTDMWNLSVVLNEGNGLADQNCKYQKFDKDTKKWSTIEEPNCAYIQGEFISGMGNPPYTPFASQNRPESSAVEKWAPEGKLVSKGPEPLVRLDLKGIKPEKAQDGTIIYRDVPTYLLEGGNAMMGWQYGYDQPMEKVTFSYNPGGVIEKEADLSAKDKKFAPADSYSDKAPEKLSKILPRRIGKIGSEIIVATPYTGFTLLNSKLQEGGEKSKHSAMLPYNPVFTVAENYVYFAKTSKPPKNNDPMYDFTKAAGSEVYRVPVSGAAFGKEELVKSVHGVITGLAYNPKTKLVGVVSVEKAAKNDKDGQKSYGYFTAIKADKTVVVEKRLPLNKEVLTKFPHTMKETVFGKTSYVGNAVLLAAADGSWIYYAAQNVKDTDPKSKYTVVGRADAYSNHNHNNLLYRITSDGTATYLEGSDTPRSYADQAMPFFAFDGVNLVRYNTEKAGLSRMQVLKYSDGKLTTLIPESRFGNAIGTATAAIDPASWGIGVITLDTRRGKLVQIAPSGRVVAEQDIPGGTFSATSIQHQGSAIFDSASGILYVPMLGTDGKFKIGKFQRSANYVEPVAEQVLGTELDPYVDRGNPNAQPPNSEQPAAEVPAPADGKPQTLPNSSTVQNHNNAADSTNKQNVTAKVKQDLPANNVAAGADAKIAQLSKTGSSAAIAGGIALSFLAMGGICVAWISARNRAALKSE